MRFLAAVLALLLTACAGMQGAPNGWEDGRDVVIDAGAQVFHFCGSDIIRASCPKEPFDLFKAPNWYGCRVKDGDVEHYYFLSAWDNNQWWVVDRVYCRDLLQGQPLDGVYGLNVRRDFD